ncbi:hypothetical protein TraAM80_05674 [Trypanosoma rangeli]|uniref:Uncharacterized protein n=1 Tax=Trypanosoma rangeli TaxID=5698 RepID=A0A3R7KC20_TRYRA|nr:uncharacterized protein TraAM80_05674 [Trypanosoma rangeli]RNF03502.1 hypothetical protein TraAM80_05674 [Trypanosoma rangeli]|eukprot:RNF03502.1 hypothetical protein TraAM80_05674 [Trypanosoma rangeli]
MFEILLEVAFSILICAILGYHVFLSVSVERTVGEEGDAAAGGRHGGGAGGYNSRSPSPLGQSRKCEGAMWCNVLGRWVALLVLGGGSIDKDVWTDRIAYFIEKGAKRIDGAIKQRETRGRGTAGGETGGRTLRLSTDCVRLLRLELGGGRPLSGALSPQQQPPYGATQQVSGLNHARTNSDGVRAGCIHSESSDGAGAAAPLIGVVLPRIAPAGIVSLEAPYTAVTSEAAAEGSAAAAAATIPMGMRQSLRCFSVPLIYEDHHFALLLLCNIPLFLALPAELKIPADVLTLRCTLSVRRVIFNGVLYAAFYGNLVELSFAREPQFTASFDVSSSRGLPRHQPRPHHAYFSQASPSSSVRGVAGGEEVASLPPLPPSTACNPLSVGHRFKDKLQEIVDLAVKRSVQSITYPCVLQGVVRSSRILTPNGGDASDDLSATPHGDGLVTWSLANATLPLCC